MLGGAVEKSWFALAKVTITYAPSQKSPAVRQISQINNSRRRPSDRWVSIAETRLAWREDYAMAASLQLILATRFSRARWIGRSAKRQSGSDRCQKDCGFG